MSEYGKIFTDCASQSRKVRNGCIELGSNRNGFLEFVRHAGSYSKTSQSLRNLVQAGSESVRRYIRLIEYALQILHGLANGATAVDHLACFDINRIDDAACVHHRFLASRRACTSANQLIVLSYSASVGGPDLVGGYLARMAPTKLVMVIFQASASDTPRCATAVAT
ncbi:hypothetical protein D9M71_463780 [compost metagenome]